jgi:hypothetical protein
MKRTCFIYVKKWKITEKLRMYCMNEKKWRKKFKKNTLNWKKLHEHGKWKKKLRLKWERLVFVVILVFNVLDCFTAVKFIGGMFGIK